MDPNETIQVLFGTKEDTGRVSRLEGPLINEELLRIFRIINSVIISQAVVLLAVVSNTINIIVFVKMGFTESINISLLGLAMSDFWSSVTMIWRNICLIPWFQELDLPFDASLVHYVYSGGLHIMFTRITGVITCFITFERCLCVMTPLKVKQIITKQRVIVFQISTYIILIAGFAPVFHVNRHEKVFYPSFNKTLVGLVFSDDREEIEKYHEPIYHILLPLLTFAFEIVFTLLLITSLRKKAKWREAATSGSRPVDGASKEKRIATMVASIAVLFIICFLPNVLIIAAMEFDPEFSVSGKRRNLWSISFSYSFIFETINASLNIFIYYKKSTAYRNMFCKIFRFQEKK